VLFLGDLGLVVLVACGFVLCFCVDVMCCLLFVDFLGWYLYAVV